MSDQERGGKMSVRENLLAGPLGFGAAPLGKYVPKHPEDEAEATVDAAWHHGTRYFGTAPFYVAGLSRFDWARRSRSGNERRRDRDTKLSVWIQRMAAG
jgi:D-threo-aldose 1-dehydrogenase